MAVGGLKKKRLIFSLFHLGVRHYPEIEKETARKVSTLQFSKKCDSFSWFYEIKSIFRRPLTKSPCGRIIPPIMLGQYKKKSRSFLGSSFLLPPKSRGPDLPAAIPATKPILVDKFSTLQRGGVGWFAGRYTSRFLQSASLRSPIQYLAMNGKGELSYGFSYSYYSWCVCVRAWMRVNMRCGIVCRVVFAVAHGHTCTLG